MYARCESHRPRPACQRLCRGVCAAVPPVADSQASPTAKPVSNGSAIIAAIAKQHYKFNPGNAPPRLKPGGNEGWTPHCDFSALGFSFKDYVQPMPAVDRRQSLEWVAFQKPVYGAGGVRVLTEIMHGPLAGIGYECCLVSSFAGWTACECRTSWVSL
jgi:hypothetical protein